jgi:hypothetical protein
MIGRVSVELKHLRAVSHDREIIRDLMGLHFKYLHQKFGQATHVAHQKVQAYAFQAGAEYARANVFIVHLVIFRHITQQQA